MPIPSAHKRGQVQKVVWDKEPTLMLWPGQLCKLMLGVHRENFGLWQKLWQSTLIIMQYSYIYCIFSYCFLISKLIQGFTWFNNVEDQQNKISEVLLNKNCKIDSSSFLLKKKKKKKFIRLHNYKIEKMNSINKLKVLLQQVITYFKDY